MANIKAAIHRIATAGLILSSVPVYALSSANENQAYEVPAKKLEQYLNNHITSDFSGSILIAQNGKVIHAQGYGLANREDNIPNALDTVFATGGLVQHFTATAILKLVEQNKLTLDDTLPQFFDNVPEEKQGITIHHLLTHTPGLFGDEKLDAFEQVDVDTFLKDVLSKSNSISPAFFLPTFTFQAGERRFGFSEGYNLLAQIIEKRSGQSFEAFLNDQLFKPAGIQNTGYRIPNWRPEQLANGYHGEDGENWGNLPARLVEQDNLSPYMKGSMGLLSTVEDLYTWHKALYAGKILREDLVKLLHTPHIAVATRFEANLDYGYGMLLSETWTGTPWIFNLDSAVVRNNLPGFTVGYHYFPEDKTVIIFASNGEASRELDDVKNMLIRVLLEPDYTPSLIHTDDQ